MDNLSIDSIRLLTHPGSRSLGITLVTKQKTEIKPKIIVNEVQCWDDVPNKEGRDVRLLSLVTLPATSISIFLCPNYPNCYLYT